MRVAICAFVMLEVLTTASSMNTEHRQLRKVNRLTEAKPKPKFNDEIGANPTNVINKEGIIGAKPKVKITLKVKAPKFNDEIGANPTNVINKEGIIGAKPKVKITLKAKAPNIFLPKVKPPKVKVSVKGKTPSKPAVPKAKVTAKAP